MFAFRMSTCRVLIQLSCKSDFPCQQGPGTQAGSFHVGITIICDCFDLSFNMSTRHVGSAFMCGGLPMSPGTRDTGLQFAARITIIRDCFDVSIPHVHMSHVDSAFM